MWQCFEYQNKSGSVELKISPKPAEFLCARAVISRGCSEGVNNYGG